MKGETEISINTIKNSKKSETFTLKIDPDRTTRKQLVEIVKQQKKIDTKDDVTKLFAAALPYHIDDTKLSQLPFYQNYHHMPTLSLIIGQPEQSKTPETHSTTTTHTTTTTTTIPTTTKTTTTTTATTTTTPEPQAAVLFEEKDLDSPEAIAQLTNPENAWQHCVKTILKNLSGEYGEQKAYKMLVTCIEDIRHKTDTWTDSFFNEKDFYARDNMIISTIFSEKYQSHWLTEDVLNTLKSTSGDNLLKATQAVLNQQLATPREKQKEGGETFNLFKNFAPASSNTTQPLSATSSTTTAVSRKAPEGTFKINWQRAHIGPTYISIDIDLNGKISDLKLKIQERTGIQPKHQYLFNLGKDLKNDEPLQQINNGKTPTILHLVERHFQNNNASTDAAQASSSFGFSGGHSASS